MKEMLAIFLTVANKNNTMFKMVLSHLIYHINLTDENFINQLNPPNQYFYNVT